MTGIERINQLKQELLVIRSREERLQIKEIIADLVLMLDLNELFNLKVGVVVGESLECREPLEPPEVTKPVELVAEEETAGEPTTSEPTGDFDCEDLDVIEQYEAMNVAHKFTEAERGWLKSGMFCRSADVRDILAEGDRSKKVSSQAITNLRNRGILNYEMAEGAGNCDYYRWSVLLRKYRIADPQAKRKNESTT